MPGLTCEAGTCAGTVTLSGSVGSLFPDLAGQLTVAVVTREPFTGVDCLAPIASEDISVADWPTSYELGGLPPGEFLLLAFIRDPQDDTQVAFGSVLFEIDLNGLVLVDGQVRTELNIGLTGFAPYACSR